MPVVTILFAWLADFLSSKAARIAIAVAFIAFVFSVTTALVNLVTQASVSVPPAVTQSMSYLLPADWALQLALIVSIKSTEWAAIMVKRVMAIGLG